MNRRKFLQKTTLASGGILMTVPEDPMAMRVFSPSQAGYQLTVMATNWGYQGNAETFCAAAKRRIRWH